MIILKELASIITRKKLMKLSILGQDEQSLLDQLYLGIARGEVKTDEEAAQLLYGQGASFPAYQKLKSKLKGRLTDMFFLLDAEVETSDDATMAYRQAWRLWSAANLMLTKGAVLSALRYAERTLELSLEYEHIDLVMQSSRVLRNISATYLADKEKFDYYNDLYQEYEEASRVEAEVQEDYELIIMLTVKAVSNSSEIAARGEAFFQELEPLLDKYHHYSIHRFIRYIQVTYLLCNQAYEETIDASQAAIDFFRTKKMKLRSTVIGMLCHQLVCYTQLKAYEAGKIKLQECLEVIADNHDRSYFKVRELGLTLFLHSKRYQEAYELASDTLRKKSLKRQDFYTQESWKICQAYIHYLVHTGRVEPAANDRIFTRFRLGRFLNEVPVFSKDKRGMNIPILVIQVLFTIAMKKYDQAFDRIEAIEKYTSRYVRSDDNYRSNCFIKMLLQIPIAGFRRRDVERHAKRYQERLEEVPLEVANQAYEIEIIPYEDMWEMALDSLD